jgi:hypothetical protein
MDIKYSTTRDGILWHLIRMIKGAFTAKEEIGRKCYGNPLLRT